MRYIFASVAVVIACTVPLSTASAGWGCGFRFENLPSGRNGRVWGLDTADEARAAAMRLCERTQKGCYIVGCRNNVDTPAEAEAIWPLGTRDKVDCLGTGC